MPPLKRYALVRLFSRSALGTLFSANKRTIYLLQNNDTIIIKLVHFVKLKRVECTLIVAHLHLYHVCIQLSMFNQ
jgi:hypothetical protein